MEQRRYHSALTPEALGDLLVQHYEGQRRTEAQRLGSGDSVVVQVRRGREGRQRVAVTLGITRGGALPTGDAPGITQPADESAPPAPAPNTDTDLVVTLGERDWFNPQDHSGAIVGSLVGALFTPWALFGLLSPARAALGDAFGTDDVWSVVENYVLTQGGTMVGTSTIQNPQAS